MYNGGGMVNVATKTNKKSPLVATSISISYGDKIIFDDISIILLRSYLNAL